MDVQEARDLGEGRLRQSAKGQLMLSEWFDEIPHDFPDSWLTVAVPAGKRSLVVAGSGKTKQYSRGGAFLCQFPSDLPGGNRHQGEETRGLTTVLDCVYVWHSRTFHVLDVMMWGDESFYDADTEERFRAISSKLGSVPLLDRCSRMNPYPFVPAPVFHSDPISVFTGLSVFHTSFKRNPDGLLCYHRKVQYLPGRKTNPLVLWLKPYMVPELMGGKVPDSIYVPSHYTDAKSFIEYYKKSHEEKKQRLMEDRAQKKHSRKNDAMDVVEEKPALEA